MTWVTTTTTILYYLSLPIITLLRCFLFPLRPFLHLFNYTFHTFILTFQYLSKFESLYIYFTTAVLIGILSGTIIHHTSHLLHSFFVIDFEFPSNQQTRPLKQKQQLTSKYNNAENEIKIRNLPPTKLEVSQAYQEYWESSSRSERRKNAGNILAQETILEEDDSDDDVFWLLDEELMLSAEQSSTEEVKTSIQTVDP